MLKSLKNGFLTLAVLATTVAGFAQPAEAQNYVNPYYGYYPQANYVNPYYNNNFGYGNPYYYGRRRSILKPALIGAGIGAGVGAGVSLLHDNDGHSRHFVRNMGIGAGVGAGVGALSGLLF